MSFRADATLATLHRHGVQFVLIGGLAANVHGSPLLTSDLDIALLPPGTRASRWPARPAAGPGAGCRVPGAR